MKKFEFTEIASLPGVREWWAARRHWFSDGFQGYIDDTIASGPSVEPQTYQDHSCLST